MSWLKEKDNNDKTNRQSKHTSNRTEITEN